MSHLHVVKTDVFVNILTGNSGSLLVHQRLLTSRVGAGQGGAYVFVVQRCDAVHHSRSDHRQLQSKLKAKNLAAFSC